MSSTPERRADRSAEPRAESGQRRRRGGRDGPDHRGYGDIREYAVKLFENHGRGIGDKEKDNGLLDPPRDQGAEGLGRGRVRLEPWITD